MLRGNTPGKYGSAGYADLSLVFQGAAIGMAIVDAQGLALAVNPAFCALTGQDENTLRTSVSIHSVFPTEERASCEEDFRRLVEGVARTVQSERRIVTNAGERWIHCTASVVPETSGANTQIVIFAKDIAARRKVADAHRKILEEIARGADPDSILGMICKLGETQLPLSRCCVFHADNERNVLNGPIGPSLPRDYLEAVDMLPIADGTGVTSTACFRRTMVAVQDTSIDPLTSAMRPLLLRHNIRALWTSPILSPSGELLGAFATYFPEPHAPTSEELQSRDECLHLAGLVLIQLQAQETLRNSESLNRTILASTSDWVAVVSTRGEIQETSRSGPDQQLPSASRWEELWRAEFLPMARDTLRKANAGEPSRFVGEFARPGQERKWWDVILSPIKNGRGDIRRLLATGRDISALKASEEALRESEERFRTLAHNLSQFAWIADSKGWIHWYNQRWYDYTGTTLEEMQGWGWRAVHHPDHVDRVVQRIQHSWDSGEDWEDTFPLRGKDGNYRWFLSRAVPIRSQDGRIIRWFGTNTDITELRDTQEALQRANEDLTHFADVASHDLQEPLRTIVTYSQLLERRAESLPAELHKHISVLTAAGQRMNSLIQDMLRYSNATRAGASRRIPVDMLALTRGVMSDMDETVRACNAEIQLEDLPVVRGDPGQLRIVMENLLSNAVKYRRPGLPPVITVDADREGAQWRFRIRDNGEGFETQYAERIFGLFKRLHNQTIPGSGIGLAIVRTVIGRHGGHAWAASEPNQGATFFFTLPDLAETAK